MFAVLGLPSKTEKQKSNSLALVGSLFLALQYLARRFGLPADTATLAARAHDLDMTWDIPGPYILERYQDRGLTEAVLLVLDLPSYYAAEHAACVLGASEGSIQ